MINIICHFEQGGQYFSVIFTKYFLLKKKKQNPTKTPKNKKVPKHLIPKSLGSSSQLAISMCLELAEMVILLFKPKLRLTTYIFPPVCRLWFQIIPCKDYTEICDKEQSLERQSRRWNECEERKGKHRFVVQLFKGENKPKLERNTEERTVSSWTRKSCKHYVG